MDSETFDFSLINLDPTSPVGNVVSPFLDLLFIVIYLKNGSSFLIVIWLSSLVSIYLVVLPEWISNNRGP